MNIQNIIFSFLISGISFGQINPNRDRQVVLKNDIVGKEFIFDKSKKDYYDRTELTYLGKIVTKDNRIFKILISKWIWGYTQRGTSRIVFFNNKNQYLGCYYVGSTSDLPTKIDSGALIFDNTNRDCDKGVVTKINLQNGIREKFFLPCKNNMGDFIYFVVDE